MFVSLLRNEWPLTSIRFSLIYPQEVVLYQVDDQLYEPAEVATTNLFNTFLDALDGVCIHRFLIDRLLMQPSLTAIIVLMVKLVMIQKLTQYILILERVDTRVSNL